MDDIKILPRKKKSSENPRIKKYDFRRPDKFSMDQIRTLSVLHDEFARLSSTALSADCRQKVEIQLRSVDQCTFQEVIAPTTEPGTYSILNNKRLRTSSLLCLDNALTSALFNRVYGGNGEDSEAFKGFTDLGLEVMNHAQEGIVSSLNESWKQLGDFPFKMGGIEHNIQFAQIIPPTEMCVYIEFAMSIGQSRGNMNLVIPYLTLEPILHLLSARKFYNVNSNKGLQLLETSRFNAIPMEVKISRNAAPLLLKQLKKLKKGSTIALASGDESLFTLGDEELHVLKTEKKWKSYNFRIQNLDEGNSISQLKKNRRESQKESQRLVQDQSIIRRIEQLSEQVNKRFEELSQGQDLLNDQIFLAEKSSFTGKELSFIRISDCQSLYDLLSKEPLQAAVLTLYFLTSPVAAALLELYPSNLRKDLSYRLSKIGFFNSEIPSLMADYFKKMLQRHSEMDLQKGVLKAAEVLTHTKSSTEKEIVSFMEAEHGEIADELKENMFVIEDLILLTEESLELLCRNAEEQDMLLSLKLLDVEVQNKVLEKLPKTLALHLRDSLENSARKYRISSLEESKQRILNLVRDLEKEGKMILDEAAFGK